MIKRCRNVGLDEPEFALTDGFVVTIRRKPDLAFKAVGGITGEVTGQVAGQVSDEIQRIIFVSQGEISRKRLQDLLQLKGRANFEERYLKPAIESGFIELTIPEKPNSRLQKYRLTEKGRKLLEGLKETQ